jgi:thioesterase domain-containing protein/aryl carrier-like protein
VGANDRLLFVNSPCFDLSVYDVFGALGAGATLVVANEALLADPVSLARSIVSRQITIWNSAPAVLQQLVEFLPNAPTALLRLVLLSGDWIPLTLPGALRRFKGVRVVSLGGATEAAIWSNWFDIERVDATWASIPYGKPIQNARYYVLDEQLEPLPVGSKGDLYIGGVCLAQGYFNRPELTHERFIPDPFHDGGRLYKTGDLAWHRADGNLELLGRSDFQVKIRGYRVELAEVEAALRALPGVTQVVCEARKDASGEKALVAHIVAEPGKSLDERELRAALARTLPAYMLPSRMLFRTALPLSCNGKIDRQRLCEIDEGREPLVTVPNNCTEQELLALWQQLLGRRAIRFDENFFEVGGHSLLAVLLIARIRERLGAEVSLAQIIENPTIARLARSIEDLVSLKPSSPHVHSYHALGSRMPLLLIPGVLGTVFTFRGLPNWLGPDQPVHVVDFLGERSRSVSNFCSVEAIAEYLEPEVVPLLAGGPAVLGGFSFGASVAFELAARLRNRGYQVPLLVSFDGQAPGYPKKLPLAQRIVELGRSLAEGAEEAPLPDRLVEVGERILRWVQPAAPVSAPSIQVLDADLQRHIDAVARTQCEASERYAPQGKQPFDLLLLKAQKCSPHDVHLAALLRQRQPPPCRPKRRRPRCGAA